MGPPGVDKEIGELHRKKIEIESTKNIPRK